MTKIINSIIYTFVGLVLFLIAVNVGFMEAGIVMKVLALIYKYKAGKHS